MTKAILGVTNHVDASGSSISASSETTRYEAENVARRSLRRSWRSAPAVTAYVDVDFGEDVDIGVIAGAFRRGGVLPAEPGGVVPALAGFEVATASAGISITVDVPASVADGELLALVIAKSTPAVLSGLTGWSLVSQSDADPMLAIYERVADSEPGDYTISWTGSDDAVAAILRQTQAGAVSGAAGGDSSGSPEVWEMVGNGLSISDVGGPALAALSNSRVAFIDGINDELRTYDFDGTDWSQIGNGLSISGVSISALAALSNSRVAFISNGDDELRAYDFDGTDWSQIGNGLPISGTGNPALAALTDSRVAFLDSLNEELRTYDFDGTDWSQIGNGLSFSGVSATLALAALTSSRVAFIDTDLDELRTYDFDGTDWSQVGNGFPISDPFFPTLAALTDSRVAFIDTDHDELRAYDFDGTDWSQIGNGLPISGLGPPALAALTSTRVAFIDEGNKELRTYDFVAESDAPTAPSLTTTSANNLVLRLFAAENDSITQDDGYPAGAEGVLVRDAGGVSLGIAYELVEAAGAVGTAAFSLTAPELWSSATVAITPADPIILRLDPDGGSIGQGATLATTDFTVDPDVGTFLHAPSSTLQARYLRLILTVSDARFVELARLWAGPILQPADNIEYPFERKWDDTGRARRHPRSAVIRAEAGPRPRDVAFQWSMLTNAEAAELLDAQRIAGTTKQVLFCWEPDDPAKTTILGAVSELRPGSHYSFDLNRQAYRITEDL